MDYEQIRQNHLRYLASILPEHVARVSWPVERLKLERTRRLRVLLRTALAASSYHRKRLRGVDPETFEERDLDQLPTMTKADLMSHWDEIVTDPRLRLDRVMRHVTTLQHDAYLEDELHAVASGGSSGLRAAFAFGWEPWALAGIGLTRMMLWDFVTSPELAQYPQTAAIVAANHASHMTSALSETFTTPERQIVRFPVTLPTAEIISGLNTVRPTLLVGYASALGLLAEEARMGRLQISPRRIISTSEPLLPHMRTAIERAFGAPVANTWGISEAGAMGNGCFRGPGMHLCDDLLVVEPVDQRGAAVPAGTCSDKILVTTISNPTLPLIRYEIDDQMTFETRRCACGSAHQLVGDVQGRLDDTFTYGDIRVHPHVFRSALQREAEVIEYQVRQTPSGASIAALGKLIDPIATQRAIEAALADLGVECPSVVLQIEARLERLQSGKIRRFIPLGSTCR